MKKLTIYLAVSSVAAALLSGCGAEKDIEEKKKTAKPVVVSQVGTRDFIRTITLTGTVKPVEDSVISAEVSGKIVDKVLEISHDTDDSDVLTYTDKKRYKKIEIGAQVNKGDVLAQIDYENYEKVYRQVEEALKVVEANLEQNRATQKQLQDDQKTNQRLFDQNVISKKALDDINTKLAEINALVKLSSARVEEAKIARDIAELSLYKTTIRCPLESALVAEVNFDLGEYVMPGTPIVRLIDIDEVWVEVGVGEKRINEVEERIEKARAESIDNKAYAGFTIPTLGNKQYKGIIEQVSPYADPASGAFTLRLRYENPSHELKGGMFAQVTLPINTRHDSIGVPRSAILTEGTRHYVFVVDKGEVSRMEVKTGVIQNEEIEIIRGLTGDETIVTDGVDVLSDGDPVRILKSPASDNGGGEEVEKEQGK